MESLFYSLKAQKRRLHNINSKEEELRCWSILLPAGREAIT